MTSDPYANIRPRRGQAVSRSPVEEDDPYARIAPRRDSLSTYAANTTVPERPSLLSRTVDAGKALGRQVIDHPWETAKGIGAGIGQNVLDATQIVQNPMGAYGAISASEGGDARKTFLRMGGAASLALPALGRVAGLSAKGLAAMDFAASAGLGAAQTPDDPGVGALLGLGMNALPYAPSAVRTLTGRTPIGPQLGPRAPVRRTVGDAGKPLQINNVMPMAVIDRIGTPPTMRTQFDAPRETPLPATSERFPEGYSAGPTPPVVARGALDRVFPEVSKILEGGREASRLADDVEAATLRMNGPTAPRSREQFLEGYQTADPNRPTMAVPQGDLPAKLFPSDADAAGGAAGAMPEAPVAGADLNDALDAAVKTWRAAKLRDAEVQRRFAVVQQFQSALDATNGNVQAALDAVDGNKDRGMIRQLMGERPKAPKAVQKAGEPPIVPGNPEGTTKIASGKSVDYRGYSDEQLAAELRRNHERVVQGQEMLANGQWVREGERGMVSGQTREAGRGKAQINQATRLLDAAERELRTRLMRRGLSGDALEDALVQARFGEDAPVPPARVEEFAETGNTDFNFGANVGDVDFSAPAPVAAAVVPEVAPIAPVAPVARPTLSTLDVNGKALADLSDEELQAVSVHLRSRAQKYRDAVDPQDSPLLDYQRSALDADIDAVRSERARRAGTPVATPPVAAAVDAAPVVAAAPSAVPPMAPSKDGAINWRTWFDQNQPGAQSAEKIMQDFVDANQPAVKAARGYESMAGTMARANAAATDFFRSLVDDPKNALDHAGIRKFVEQHGEAGVPALKQAVARTAAVMSEAAKVIADPTTSADDLVLAHRVVDSAFQTQDQLLGGVIKEQARIGRSMNALKIQAKLSVDPDVWMIHAKRALGDAPMTDEVMARVRQLARDAGDACGGG